MMSRLQRGVSAVFMMAVAVWFTSAAKPPATTRPADSTAAEDALRLAASAKILNPRHVSIKLSLTNLSTQTITVKDSTRPGCTVSPEHIVLFHDGHVVPNPPTVRHFYNLPFEDRDSIAPNGTLIDAFNLIGIEPGLYDLVGLVSYEIVSESGDTLRTTVLPIPHISFHVPAPREDSKTSGE
jgi:hypothetical protein